MQNRLFKLAAVAELTVLATAALAVPADIVVRVLSKDAKFIGTSMGGMRVTLRDGHTGKVLATGLTRGGTGDTERRMHESAGRRAQLSDPSAARFSVTVDQPMGGAYCSVSQPRRQAMENDRLPDKLVGRSAFR
ncbi:MAG: hypothetical protein K8F92_13975 [Hyphomicrobium sp.]|uniref:hypothetical protein n=1 Tax=Hyphomicrobium sp. TaxID=82 RepID=UPI001328A87B|nr:hypothetical protein [Hyphomicrobium sp.]KAB2943498.1 MAG: hypothetical protein F9K20_02090 [Hyphomicrobium sp.]MBZ0210746.1 hypothetical protein [Hyphomicrobium sp.]